MGAVGGSVFHQPSGEARRGDRPSCCANWKKSRRQLQLPSLASETQRAQAETNSGRQAQVPTTASESWQNDSGFDASAMEPSKIKTSTWEASTSETSNAGSTRFEAPTFCPSRPRRCAFTHLARVQLRKSRARERGFSARCARPTATETCARRGAGGSAQGLPGRISPRVENGAERAGRARFPEDNSFDYEIACHMFGERERRRPPRPVFAPRKITFLSWARNPSAQPQELPALYGRVAVAHSFRITDYMALREREFSAPHPSVNTREAATPSAAAPRPQPEPVSAAATSWRRVREIRKPKKLRSCRCGLIEPSPCLSPAPPRFAPTARPPRPPPPPALFKNQAPARYLRK